MSNTLEYILSLQDSMSAKLRSIGVNSDAALNKFASLQQKTIQVRQSFNAFGQNITTLKQKLELLKQERDVIPASNFKDISRYNSEINRLTASIQKLETAGVKQSKVNVGNPFSGMSNMLGAIGISAGIYQIGTLFTEGIEKAHQLHQAEAALANTMQNMGTFSQGAFEKAISGSKKLAANIKFTGGDIIGLQSQLRLVGNIGENEMQRMISASADMATKFDTQLNEAGNAIAKAINNPEMMRRLAMQLKIDPKAVEHIQNLAKHGKEAQARLELLGIVESKVGGAARAAFDADPSARFSKAMDKIKLTLGELGISFQKYIMPAVEWFADKFLSAFNRLRTGILIISGLFKKLWNVISNNVVVQKAIDLFRSWWDLFDKGNPIIIGITAVLGAMLAMTILHTIWSGVATVATWLWAAAQSAFNATMWANPITWIIAGIIALIAAIAYVIYKTDGWGKLWGGLVKFFTNTLAGFKEVFIIKWLEIQDSFMSGIELIERGWYRVKALWDKEGANAGLAKLNDESNKRAAELAAARNKGKEYGSLAAQGWNEGWGSLKWNSNRSLKGLVSGLKDKLGIGGEKVSPEAGMGGNGNNEPGGLSGAGGTTEAIATGGTKSTNITINLKSLIEGFVINARGSFKESAEEMKELVLDEMTRVLSMAQSIE